jgi:hypothetical protein
MNFTFIGFLFSSPILDLSLLEYLISVKKDVKQSRINSSNFQIL